MPAPRMPEVTVAEQAGVGADGRPRRSEDRVLVLGNGVVLLDGATPTAPLAHTPVWYVTELGDELASRLGDSPNRSLAEVLAGAIGAVTGRYNLRPDSTPTSTVAMLRWTDDTVDALVLADSPVVVFGRSGEPEVLTDDRLAVLRKRGALRTPQDVAMLRNTDGGFWVAGTDRSAAGRAIQGHWPRAEVNAALLATDGVSAGVEDYQLFDWTQALGNARRAGVRAVLEQVRTAERDDPHRRRWPRPKVHDDKAIALVEF